MIFVDTRANVAQDVGGLAFFLLVCVVFTSHTQVTKERQVKEISESMSVKGGI